MNWLFRLEQEEGAPVYTEEEQEKIDKIAVQAKESERHEKAKEFDYMNYNKNKEKEVERNTETLPAYSDEETFQERMKKMQEKMLGEELGDKEG